MYMHPSASDISNPYEPSPSQPCGPGPALSRFTGKGLYARVEADHASLMPPYAELPVQPQHIAHVIHAWRLADGPQGGAKRASGEDVAAAGAVGQFQAFAVTRIDDGVVAGYVAAAERSEADRAFLARAGDAVAAAYGNIVQHNAPAGGGAAQAVRRPSWLS